MVATLAWEMPFQMSLFPAPECGLEWDGERDKKMSPSLGKQSCLISVMYFCSNASRLSLTLVVLMCIE